ncbi:MAG TPA: pyruvate kinase [Alphaproteobacteria bacterium]|nr:pyruvate kinase [Alphaproteobacteria bacterium]
MKKTKIVCTIGPKTESVEKLTELVNAGMNVMRLNFSHGNFAEHSVRIQNIRQVSENLNKKIAVLLDTKGPEIRTIKLENGEDVTLTVGQSFTFTTDTSVIGNKDIVAVTYPGFAKDLNPGAIILVDDGLIEMEVVATTDTEVKCTVLNTGDLGENKGVNLPNISVGLPALSEKDKADLAFGCEQEVDFVAASFIRKADDVREIREVLFKHGGENIQIISKIENQEGVDNFDEILAESDGIMVARGDLGVEVPFAKVPLIQKSLIKQAQDMGKTVVVATQMLDSMVRNPSPTRAEASDIANAVFDGADAVMLSNESAAGDHPQEAVQAMASIAAFANQAPYFMRNQEFYFAETPSDEMATEDAISSSAAMIAEQLESRAIVCYTATGSTARRMSRQRPTTRIWSFSPDVKVARALALNYGISARVIDQIESVDQLMPTATAKAKEFGAAKEGEKIVITFGSPIGKLGSTNSIRVATV